MTSVAAVSGLFEAISAGGGNPDQILRLLGFDRTVLSNREGFISSSVFTLLLEEAARSTGDDCFGLHFGERYNPMDIGPLAYAILNAPTIASACETAGRYMKVVNEAVRMSHTVVGDRVYIRHLLVDVELKVPRQHNEFGTAVLLNMFRMIFGKQWVPRQVQFAHKAPAQTSEHLRVFEAPIVFDCTANALVIERECFEGRVPAADPRLYPILRRYLEEVLSATPREDSLLASVRRNIAESMTDGDPKLSRVARRIATSPRTLQRKLKEHGVDFKKLMDDTRRRFAISYLQDHKNTLTQVAFLLGYSELSAFNRAFKRWTGATPLDYRRKTAR